MSPRCVCAAAIGLAGLFSGGYTKHTVHTESFRSARVSTFNKSDRSVLAEVLADGKPVVILNVASRAGQNAAVAEELSRLGATVRFREDTVDYLSLLIPVERADHASRLPGIEVASVDMGSLRPLTLTEHMTEQAPSHIRRPRFAAPDPTTARDNPFLPTRDIGAPQFVAAHPTFDGRGVTIGIVDTGVEVSLPELQTAMTPDGRPTRKIVDWLNTSDPFDYLLPLTYPGNALASMGYPFYDSTWVAMTHEVMVTGRELVYNGVAYTVPSAGRYRIGLFDERSAGSFVAADFPGAFYLHGDVNRDGNPPDSDGLFAVLWNETTNDVWVDTNQDHSFADERAMTDYGVRFDIGTFGGDDPATPVRESVPFVIQTDSRSHSVIIGLTIGPHGTMVAGIAAGRGFFGGAFDGVAPGARIASVMFNTNSYEHSITEALITAAKHPSVDIISLAVGAEGSFDGERSVCDVVVNRLVERYGKPIVDAAGNHGPGTRSLIHASAATQAISVGGYIGRDSWLAVAGAHVASDDSLATLSARGPRADGALKPDVVAPTIALSLQSATFAGHNQWNTYELPAGYLTGGGTSAAAPFVSGALALLISAARQQGITVDPWRLRLALANGARYLLGYGAHEQGNGLVQVEAAWQALQQLRELPARIRVDAPVNTTESSGFEPPDRGPGLYEREGWSPGQRGSRTVTLTRTTGPPIPLEYNLRWLGNDGTFETQSAVTLTLNAPVDISLTVAPAAAGVHSAILQVVDRSHSLMIHQMAITVVAAEEFTASQGYRISHAGQAPRPGSTSHFFHVPQDVPLLHIAVRIGNGSVRVQVHDATGANVDSYTSNNTVGYQPAGAEWSRAFERPRPGVWEVIVENSQDTDRVDRSFPNPLPPSDYAVRAELLGAGVALVSHPSARTGGARDVPIAVTNQFGSFNGALKGSVLGTARSERTTLTREVPRRVFRIDVPPGADRLLAEVDNASDPGADIDLYLFDCTGKRCALRAHSTGDGSREQVKAYTPAAGIWNVVVDAFRLAADSTRVEYRDLLLHPLYGRLEVTDAPSTHAPHDRWQASAVARVQARPQTDRSLVGFVDLIADDVNDVERTPKGMVKWPAALGRILINVDRSPSVVSR